MFYICEINGKKIIKSSIIPELEHCFTTRDFVITSNEKGMKETIEQNQSELFKYMHINPHRIIKPIQTHSSNVAFAQKGKYKYPDTDAIILTHKGQSAIMNFADCTPIILYDRKLNIAALVHAGWRGTVSKIVMKTIFKIEQKFENNMEDVVAIIGPTIGPCCYEIGDEVYEQLCAVVDTETNEDCFIRENNRLYADLRKINQYQILSTGIKKIDIINYCTSCDNDKFFSYRREAKTTNRNSVIIKLN